MIRPVFSYADCNCQMDRNIFKIGCKCTGHLPFETSYFSLSSIHRSHVLPFFLVGKESYDDFHDDCVMVLWWNTMSRYHGSTAWRGLSFSLPHFMIFHDISWHFMTVISYENPHHGDSGDSTMIRCQDLPALSLRFRSQKQCLAATPAGTPRGPRVGSMVFGIEPDTQTHMPHMPHMYIMIYIYNATIFSQNWW